MPQTTGDGPAPAARPQPILGGLTATATFLVATVEPGGEAAVRDLLGRLDGLQRSVGFAFPEAAVSCVVGIGSQAYDRLFSGPRPARLHPFRELNGAVHRAVSTPGDLLFHIRATRADLCFELAREIMDRLRGAVAVVDEVLGFRYYDARDLLGFVDGTENPVGAEAAAAALIGAEDARFAGGSYVIVQKYLHDVAAWEALPVEAQERVIGRTKLRDIEFDDDEKPVDSHVALNTVTDADGGELQILRDNMPFGSAGHGEFGTYFIGYARDPGVTEQMLRNMFLGRGAAGHDRILDYSTAVTGTLFFVPGAGFLEEPPDPPGADASAVPSATPAPASAAEPAPAPATTDHSLGIGALRRNPAP
jgi:putative iron-dependent peroxidase